MNLDAITAFFDSEEGKKSIQEYFEKEKQLKH